MAAAVVAVGGCASPVTVPAGPQAADPVCAEVLQALPGELAGGQERSIASQSIAGWGEPAITLRCGVDVPGPSTERCITVESGDTSVDWLALEADDEMVPDHARRENGSWTFITYGRVPAVEVVVPTERGGDQPTGVLVDLATAVELTTAERTCIGADDV
ncbi:Protein of unknown function [Georgenia satyanarayanai]|uniref:DUF3515 domain-containing protein n=1 Tax=Georgenia satyanarayanai TaxID=860221 RepID=A0A2Y9AUK4_9MICO|nr:uncharacterized protein DUF3515 [Georgenia satyanarayanai]SSA47028.1 Protein of unknown function [Georgenia satyanarayanai]